MKQERRFPLKFIRGEVVIRWRETSSGPAASVYFNDHVLAVTWRRTTWRNGVATEEPQPSVGDDEDADLMPPAPAVLSEFPARGLIDDIDSLSLEPVQDPPLTGLAATGASLDPRNWQTHRFVMRGGHRASGVVYNSSVTSKRSIRIDVDTMALTATYHEVSDFDDS